MCIRLAQSVWAFTALAVATTFAFGKDFRWSNDLVCQAGVHAYFYLRQPPRRIGNVDDKLVFRSASGATYDCQVRGNAFLLNWKNDTGPMSSNSTKFEISGSTLTVQPAGVSSWWFRLIEDGYVTLE